MIQSKLRKTVQDELNSALQVHQVSLSESVMNAVMKSRAVTPVPSGAELQAQQNNLIALCRKGEYQTAFQQALCAADLQLIVFLCQYVPAGDVFGQGTCPLTQPVLLSLLQQLSTDFTNNIETKLSYIDEAIIHVSTSDPATVAHVPQIILGLKNKLETFLRTNPTSPFYKRVRMLLLATQGLPGGK
jgi:enhancer of mRNA-decapping protein 4